MILPASYSPEWIREKRKDHPKSDPAIMEKVIYAGALFYWYQTLRLFNI